MKLRFNLDYTTNYGEELTLDITSVNGAGRAESHRMLTQDGHFWSCEMTSDVVAGGYIDYHYTVKLGGDAQRTEWLLAPHRLTVPFCGAHIYNVYDEWVDIPEDAYLYSSAMTDCIAARRRALPALAQAASGVELKVRAPQLRHGERLALVGGCPALGEWDASKATDMVEAQPNEWTACLDRGTLPDEEFEFKFVILGGEEGGEPLWEDHGNRRLTLPHLEEGEAVAYELQEAFFPIYAWKGAGTVIPVFSLRSEGSFGVGDFGDLSLMVDWAAKTGQRIVQILPVNDTTITHTWVDSYPYKSISIYALHPQYADLRQLPKLSDPKRAAHYEQLRRELNDLPQIDYERVNEAKLAYLHELFAEVGEAVLKSRPFKAFFKDNEEWLVPYAAFCHYRDLYGTATFSEWPDNRQPSPKALADMANAKTEAFREVSFWFYVQYVLDAQLKAARDHAHQQRVILKGDIPIGVSRDGVEAWVEPRYFHMDGQAGAPPDAFSTNGQNWGFPTYNWQEMLADGCSWWMRRFRKMAEYFDAYRIDHVLGFFRIWEIPINAVHGLLGQFSPALGMTRGEIEAYGLHFDEDRFTRPFITDWVLERIFHDQAAAVREAFLDYDHDDLYRLKPAYDTQRKIEAAFEDAKMPESLYAQWIRDGLYALVSDVLFLRDKENPDLFHPRVGVQMDFIYESLWDCDKAVFNRLYDDYFYRRNNQFWYGEAMKKLERLTQATRMLVCAEDLGMVPSCVPWVMDRLRILTLEIQTMPKDSSVRFGHLSANPYRSVCTFSTHDMPTLRQWWDEDSQQTQEYYGTRLYRGGGAPHPLPGWLAKDVVTRHLNSPSMLCLLSLQDWLSIDDNLRLPDKDAERINIPANPRHYWRYRMHLSIEQLMAADGFNETISKLISESGR